MWHSHCTPIKSRLRAWKWERSEKDSKIKAMADGKTKAGDSSSSGTAKPTKGRGPLSSLMSEYVPAVIRTTFNLPVESGGCLSLLSGPDMDQGPRWLLRALQASSQPRWQIAP